MTVLDPPSPHLLQADLERVLRAYDPSGPGQEGLRLEYLAHLQDHPDAVWKSGPPAHFTTSCLVLDESLTRTLLTHHRRARMWFQLGGHLETADVSVRAAATREAAEESGIGALRVTPLPVHLDRHVLHGDFGRCREHLDIRYAAIAPDGAVPQVSAESLDLRWWSLDDLPPGHVEELDGLVAAALGVLRS